MQLSMAWFERVISSIILWSIHMQSEWRIVLCLSVVSFFLAALVTTASAADPESNQPLDCTSCHQKTLEYHDKLGSDNNACWTCHDSTDMTQLRVANGTRLSPADSNQLCGQCHQARYNAWQEGTHGFPDTVASGKCADCHDPHQPQMSFTGITKSHPEPAPPAPSPPFDLVMIIVIALAFMTGLGIVIARQRTES